MRPLASPLVWYGAVIIIAAFLGAFGPDPFAPLVSDIAAHGGAVRWLAFYGFLP